jgi:hypothetical protein
MTPDQRVLARLMQTPRERAHQRVLVDAAVLDRLHELPNLCDRIASDPTANEESAELALRDLPYARVMQIALRVQSVRAVLALLPADFTGWAR